MRRLRGWYPLPGGTGGGSTFPCGFRATVGDERVPRGSDGAVPLGDVVSTRPEPQLAVVRHQNPERVLRGGLRGVVPAEIGLELAVFALDHDDDGAREDDVAREQDALSGPPGYTLATTRKIVWAGGEDQARRGDAAVALEDRVQLLLRESSDPPRRGGAPRGAARPGRGSGGGPNEYRISPALRLGEDDARGRARARARSHARGRREDARGRGGSAEASAARGRCARESRGDARASARRGRAAEIRVARQDEDMRIRRRSAGALGGDGGGEGDSAFRGRARQGDGGGRASAGEATFREGSRVASRGVR